MYMGGASLSSHRAIQVSHKPKYKIKENFRGGSVEFLVFWTRVQGGDMIILINLKSPGMLPAGSKMPYRGVFIIAIFIVRSLSEPRYAIRGVQYANSTARSAFSSRRSPGLNEARGKNSPIIGCCRSPRRNRIPPTRRNPPRREGELAQMAPQLQGASGGFSAGVVTP